MKANVVSDKNSLASGIHAQSKADPNVKSQIVIVDKEAIKMSSNDGL